MASLLFLTPQLPYPPYSGGPLRNYGLIDGLSRAGYTLDLLTFVEPGAAASASPPEALVSRCRRIVTIPTPERSTRQRLRDLLTTPHADIVRRYHSPDYAAALSKLLAAQRYDAVQIEGLEMSGYLPLVRELNPKARIIYDAHNAEYHLQRLIYRVDRREPSRWPAALYSIIQWRRLMRLEREVCRAAARVIAVSEADAGALRALVPDLDVNVIPNGIYVAEYTRPAPRLDLGKAAILFTGTMNYRPNVDAVLWFTGSVMAKIRSAVPEARLFVVGNRPHDRLDSLRRRGDIEITGFVQDVSPFLQSATVYVAPLRMGSGTRLKLLQAMAAGCAIVSTRVGAEGLSVVSGREMLIADDDDAAAFAGATISLLNDPALRERLGGAARDLVCREYDWSVLVPKLLRVYEELGV